LFDLILNNADRKGGHILVDENNHLWLIDHGTTFHSEFKLRSVVWDFSGQEIPESLLSDVERLGQDLATNVNLLEELLLWLTEIELHALQKRINIILHLKTFPFPDKNRRTVPWPPL
jgi:uncharacterized repeat protein (TIGR03843 family)